MDKCIPDNLLKLFLAHQCSAPQREEIELHLKACEKCRERLHGLRISEKIISPDDATISIDGSDRTLSMPPVSATGKTFYDVTATLETMSDGYEILGELPRGGQAAVFKAIQKATKRVVAVKVLLQGGDAPKIARFRFEKEIELAASLRHPNIVTIYDSGIAQGQYYYAMEFVPGVPLDDYVRDKKLSARETMELFLHVVSGVSYAHQKGVIHRDLKPGNILVDAQGKPHILDFGLAKVLDTSEATYEGSVMMSMTGQVLGTLAYMAPEQAAGRVDDVDVRTDVYALGVILYKLLLGHFPYEVVGSVLAVIRNIQDIEPEKFSKANKINSEIEVIVLKALAKEPGHRYQSASELFHDIDNWLKGYPIVARADNSWYVLYKLVRRHRLTTAVVILLLVIIISFGAVSFDLYRTADAAQGRAEQIAEKRTEQMQLYQALARKITFTMFLQAWAEDDLKRAAQFRHHFEMMYDRDTETKGTAAFLMNQQDLSEKEPFLRAKLGEKDTWLAAFMVAEIQLKAGQKNQALTLYKQSLDIIEVLGDDFEQSDMWLKEVISTRFQNLKSNIQGKTD